MTNYSKIPDHWSGILIAQNLRQTILSTTPV